MSRSGHRVLVHANGWRKEAGDEIELRIMAFSRDGHAPTFDLGQPVEIWRDGTSCALRLNLDLGALLFSWWVSFSEV